MTKSIPALVALITAAEASNPIPPMAPAFRGSDSLCAIVTASLSGPVYFRFSIKDDSILCAEFRPNPAAEAYTVESLPWAMETGDSAQLPRKITESHLIYAVTAFRAIYDSLDGFAIIGIQPSNGSFVIRVLGVIPKCEIPKRYTADIYS